MSEAAARAGERLIEQRDLCEKTRGGSTFSRWCEEELPFDRRTAGRYIEVAENWEQLALACSSSPNPPSIREALKLIAEAKREEPEIELPEGTRVIDAPARRAPGVVGGQGR